MPGKKAARKGGARKADCVDKALKQLPSKRAVRKKTKEPIFIEVKGKENNSSKAALITRSLKGTPTSPMPTDLRPMQASLIREPFNDPEWIYEIKWDGYRTLAYIQEDKVQLRSRNNLSFSRQFPLIAEVLKTLRINAVLDGEVVMLNEKGKPDFQALQNWKSRRDGFLTYYVFDLLWLNGFNLMKEPLWRRKQILQKLLPAGSGVIRYCDHVQECGKEFYEVVEKNELEGILAKHRESIYLPGEKTRRWLKLTKKKRESRVIGGWTESENRRSFKSLLFGYFEKGKFIHDGHAGGGFKEKDMPVILEVLKKIEIKTSPFEGKVVTDRDTHWVKPQLVIEIEYAARTDAGYIRKPAIFLGFRSDKRAKDVEKGEGG
jgi:bifunctional non-homologous end joining protein LigD